MKPFPLTEQMSSQSSIDVKHQVRQFFEHIQEYICVALEKADGLSEFVQNAWTHPENGGGKTRIMDNGEVFEKAGVNYSSVSATLTETLASRLGVSPQRIFATGISLVIHPASPMIPTVHMNLRYLELTNGDAWFGGGTDLTPNYLFEEDVRHFHRTLKTVCDKHDPSFYPRFKRWCDEYFFVKHRGEARGVGGIFFDYQRGNLQAMSSFVQELGRTFLDAYIPIVERRRNEPWGEREKNWQLIRRGRYAEFNLVYDRGTLFGLETQGRAESILMSLPPEARWPYNFSPEPHSPEARLLEILKTPKEWV